MTSQTNLCKFTFVFTLGITSVLPTLWGDFLFDDGEAILKNSDVVESKWEGVWQIFVHDFWGVDITHPLSHKSYRPLTTLSYKLDYYLWGRNPYPFHLSNLLLHGLNCVLVLKFLSKCVQHVHVSKSSCAKCQNYAFWGAVLFSVHPVHVEPLGAVVGRADLIAAFIFLGAFCLVSRQRRDHSNLLFIWTDGIFIAISSVFGALFKETAISLAVVYLVMDLYVRLKECQYNKSLVHYSVVFKYLCVLGITTSFVVWRLWMQGGPPVFQPYDNPPAFVENIGARIVNIVYIWILNVLLLLSPTWLCYDWSMDCVQLIKSIWDTRFLIVVIFVIVCLWVAFLSTRKRIIMVSAIIFASTFLPSSNILFIVGFVLAERNLYLPSIGYCLFIAYVFLRLDLKKPLVFLMTVLYFRSMQRSVDWMSQESLFKSALNVCPNNAKVHYNLGTMYGDLNEHNSAEQAYKTAISLRPDYYQAMNNLGNLLRVNNQLSESEYWLSKAVKIKPDFAAAWMNLGIVLSSKNQSHAMICYENALKYRKSYPDCEYNLGNLFLDMGNKEKALEAWKRATTLKPTQAQAWINSVILLEQEDRLEEARRTALKALTFLQKDDTLYFILGNILGKLSQFESAKVSFETAIKLRLYQKKNIPPKYFSNLGVLYHRWGKKEQAIKAYQEALNIDPDSSSTKKNLESVIKSLANKREN